MEKPSINPAVGAATRDLGAGDLEGTPDGNGGGAADPMAAVGVLPNGEHTGRLRKQQQGKAGGTGMALVEAVTKMSDRNNDHLNAFGVSASEIASGVKAMTTCLARMAAAYEEDNKQTAAVHAAKAQRCEVQTLKEKIEIVKLLKDIGGITEDDAKKFLAELTLALLKPAVQGPNQPAVQVAIEPAIQEGL